MKKNNKMYESIAKNKKITTGQWYKTDKGNIQLLDEDFNSYKIVEDKEVE